MPTEDQLLANLQNARKSTGPITPEGKKRSSVNALRHGFTGQKVVVADSEAGIYNQHCQDYRDEFSPKGKVESDLTLQLAGLSWSMNRIRACESTLFAVESVSDSSRDVGDCEINSAIAVAGSLEKNMKTLSLLSIYEQRKQRAYERTLAQLRELQKERKSREESELYDASLFKKAFENEEPGWVPAKDGFVCSDADLEAYIRYKERWQFICSPHTRKANNDDRGREDR
jgi:hypothetical protein